MKKALEEEGQAFSLFGGEPLLVPLGDLEELWSFGLSRFGRNSVQTNGTLITEAHIDLFKRYRVHVGLSLDGPGELNDARWSGTLEQTRADTVRSEKALDVLCKNGLVPSIIVTLSRANAGGDRLPVLLEWLIGLDEIGIRSARLHLLETESDEVSSKYGLTESENIKAMLACWDLQRQLRGLRFDVFADLERLLTGCDARATCTWAGCDPYTTRAVRGIEGRGERSNCGRTNKDGIEFDKADYAGYERYLALYATPLAVGGCQGCRFFIFCKGQCPGTAIDGDWRNRTEHCGVWYSLLERTERDLLRRGERCLSTDDSLPLIEHNLIAHWVRGENVTIESVLKSGRDLAKTTNGDSK